jgi:hypothetical protein
MAMCPAGARDSEDRAEVGRPVRQPEHGGDGTDVPDLVVGALVAVTRLAIHSGPSHRTSDSSGARLEAVVLPRTA